MNWHDVIIVGSGPAGSTLAYELGCLGVDVLVLEKEKLPRMKICAGGVCAKTVNLLPFSVDPVIDIKIYGIRFARGFRDEFTRFSSTPLVYMTERAAFDHFLVEKARQEGAKVLEGQKVLKLEMDGEKVKIYCRNNEFTSRIVAGADGALSIVAKNLDLFTSSFDIAIESRVYPKKGVNIQEDLIYMDWGTIPNSYSWIFPKKDHLSMGVSGDGRLWNQLKQYYISFKELLKDHYQIEGFKGHILPMRRDSMPIQKDGALLLGDAAGLVNPFSGEGIFYAIRSAQLAAPVIAEALQKKSVNLKEYEEKVEEELMPDLNHAKKVKRLFNLCPFIFHESLRRRESWWAVFCNILEGKNTFADVKKKLKGLGFVLDLI